MEGVLLLDGELTAVDELANVGVLAVAVAAELAMVLVEVVALEGLAPPQGPHPPLLGGFRGTASTKGEAASVSSRRYDRCMTTGVRRRIFQREAKC